MCFTLSSLQKFAAIFQSVRCISELKQHHLVHTHFALFGYIVCGHVNSLGFIYIYIRVYCGSLKKCTRHNLLWQFVYVYMLEQSVVVCELYMPEHCVASCTCQSILWQFVMSEKWKSMHTVAVCKIVHAWAFCGNLLSCTCQSILWQCDEWEMKVKAYCGSLWNCTCQSILWQFVELYMSEYTVAVCDDMHAKVFCDRVKVNVKAYCDSL